jgi:AcrR family transcriptional regulator
LSITIEHDKRKREILEKALDVFVAEGYEDTTFQKIAERCGITRTILYLYFKNKREIFSFSIKLFTEKLEGEIRNIGSDSSKSQSEKLAAILAKVIETCAAQGHLLSVILDYLGHIKAAGGDPDERVRRRTIRMRHILAGILIDGQKKGDFSPFSVKVAGDLIYSLIESAIFRIAVLGRDEVSSLVEASALLSASLRSSEPKPKGRVAQGSSRSASAREGRASS